MRANEFVTESMTKGVIDKSQERAFSNTSTFPNQNMYHGSGYLHNQFLKALAGAGAGNTPSINMGDENWAAGNPIATPYSVEEEEMLANAARHVGDDSKHEIGKQRSEELPEVNKTSPGRNPGPIARQKK